MGTELKDLTRNDLRPAALERPEAKDERVVRVSARFFRIAAEEGLQPFEMAVAWQRIGRTILRESIWKVATSSLLRTLAKELIEELTADPSRVEKGGEA